MNVLRFIEPFEMFFTSDLFTNLILKIFLPFVIVGCCVQLIREVITK